MSEVGTIPFGTARFTATRIISFMLNAAKFSLFPVPCFELLLWMGLIASGWRGGLMVSALDSGPNVPGSSLGQGSALCS